MIIGLFLIWSIGRAFFKLAKEIEKNKWFFAVLGVLSYYVGTVVGAFIIFVVSDLFLSSYYNIESIDENIIGLIAIPFGVLACWGFYKILEKNWKTNDDETYIKDDTILDANL
ncbi:hypothetical protein V9L05_03285 [Bernardetia sp. Wsw4-3y2]|uniref:hypothetical protein n=1 Tax=Bernardetia sp. Wsw4-3y2 TaxID=3127471 RepID=UPI0030CB0122